MTNTLYAALAGFAIAAFTSTALAEPTKQECLDSNSNAQALRMGGKLRAAREALLVCGSAACPAIVRDDCQQRMDDLERAFPTIVFDAKDPAGNDLLAVKVTMDGHPLTERLDGTPIPVDVGEHEFTFEVPGQPVMRQRFVIREGEKARHERIVVGEPAKPAATRPVLTTVEPDPANAAPTAVSADTATSSTGTAQRVVGLLVTGVGLVGIGVGVGLAVYGSGKNNDIATQCPDTSSCPEPNHTVATNDASAAHDAFTGATIAFVAGGVAALTGLVVFLVAPSAKRSARFDVVPTYFAGGGGVSLTGRFE